jgi:hypothetical protein
MKISDLQNGGMRKHSEQRKQQRIVSASIRKSRQRPAPLSEAEIAAALQKHAAEQERARRIRLKAMQLLHCQKHPKPNPASKPRKAKTNLRIDYTRKPPELTLEAYKKRRQQELSDRRYVLPDKRS